MICLEKYTIQEVSDMKDISKSKLRYYEKHGLLMNIERNEHNQRVYSHKDIEMIGLIQCFSLLNMSLKQIKQNVDKLSEDETQISDILEAHLTVLKAEREIVDLRISAIEEKLSHTKKTT